VALRFLQRRFVEFGQRHLGGVFDGSDNAALDGLHAGA
jgi:hypothetical protein